MIKLEQFYNEQLTAWHDCAERYLQLAQAQRRTIMLGERPMTLVHNPARARSTKANLSAEAIAARPCFLCAHHRPAEQRFIELALGPRTYQLAVNPFPITDHHFTIIDADHVPQTMSEERLRDMLAIARLLNVSARAEGRPPYLVFFNGAKAGASAPDHFHFQAVPLPQGATTLLASRPLVEQYVELQRAQWDLDSINILCVADVEGAELGTESAPDAPVRGTIIRRTAHRPWQYALSDDDPRKLLISPAALEFAGLVPLVREQDYAMLSPEQLQMVLAECGTVV